MLPENPWQASPHQPDVLPPIGADANLARKAALIETCRREIQNIRDAMKQTDRLFLESEITAQGFGDLDPTDRENFEPDAHRTARTEV